MQSKTNVATMIDDQHRKNVEENCKCLVPIIKTTILCARLGIAYRRRGKVEDTGTDLRLVKDEGNFNALLAFRIDAGDKMLESHPKSTGKNATYISTAIQNELISICGELISENIVSDILKAKNFSVLADETADTSH